MFVAVLRLSFYDGRGGGGFYYMIIIIELLRVDDTFLFL